MLYRASFIASKGTLLVVNTLHVRTNETNWATGWDAANPSPTDLASELEVQLGPTWRALLPTTYMHDRIAVTSVGNPNDPTQVPSAGEKPVALAGTRTVTDENLPATMCGILSLRTGFSGRSFRGRMFLPPIEASNQLSVDLLSIGGTYSTAVNAFKNKLDDSFGGGATWSTLWNSQWNARVVVYSPTRHARTEDPWASNVSGTRYDRTVHWLRSRRH